MIEQTITCKMTSKDAQHLMEQLQRIEQSYELPTNLTAMSINIRGSVPKTVIKFVADIESPRIMSPCFYEEQVANLVCTETGTYRVDYNKDTREYKLTKENDSGQ